MSAVGVGAAAQTRALVKASMVAVEKCTFIHASKLGAPTFAMAKTGAAPMAAAAEYEVHYMEYGTGPYKQPGLTDGAHAVTGLAKSWFPVHADFTAVRARLYSTVQGGSTGAWLPAAANGLQEYGHVWTYHNAVDAKAATTGAVGYLYKRWFPVAIAEAQIAAYKARVTAFTALKGTYDADKTKYNKFLTDTATKPDFFASLFGTATAVTIVLRPGMPAPPEAYSGLYQFPFPTERAAYTGIEAVPIFGVTGGWPATQEFVVDGMHGGWGAWTMGLLAAAEGAGRSFGTLGWAKAAAAAGTVPAYDPQAQSFVQDPREMCLAAAGTGFCPQRKNANGTALEPVVATAVWQILVVSVWARTAAAAAFATGGGQGVTLAFSLSKWADKAAAWAKPAAPGAATAPDTPAGAKMLAASAAAAAAVAAALY